MKKISSLEKRMRIFASVSVFALSVSFYACSVFSNIEVPEKISVKSDAKFSVAIGERSVDMNDIFGDSLQKHITENTEGLKVFKYVPDKNDDTLQYLLHSNIYNFDLDIGEQFADLDMDDMLNGDDGIDVDEKIQVPEIKSPEPQPFKELNNYFVNGVASTFAGKATWKIDTPIEFDKNGYIKTAVIKNNATIEIKVAKPAGTTGVELELSSFTITGAGLDFKATDFENVPDSNYLLFKRLAFTKLDEAKRTLDFSKGDITINGLITVTIEKGAKCNGLNTEIAINMKEIEKATADFSKLVNFKKDENNGASKLSENMLKHVGMVTFGEKDGDSYYKHEAEGKRSNTKSEGLGIKCEIVNSLPAGNDIDITVLSKVFKITAEDSKPWNIKSHGNENANTELWSVFKDIDFTEFDSENPPYMDFEIKLSDNQTLTNLEFGKEYAFSIKNSQFVFDWDSAEVQLSELQDEPIEGENDLSSMSKETLFGDLDGEIGEFIRDNIDFGDNVKAYFYVQKPNDAIGIGDITLSGTVDMIYTSNGKPKKDSILDEKNDFKLSDAVKWKTNKEKEFTTNLKNTNFVANYDMTKILQSGVEDAKLKYDIKIADDKSEPSTIYKLALDNLGEDASTSISIDAAIVFPLELKIKKGATLDILKAADFDEDKEDMFDREKGSDEDYAKYLDYIGFNYNLKNKAITGFDFKIVIDDRHPEAEGTYTEIFKEFDGNEIKFSTGDAKKIFENLFMPKIYLKFDDEKDTGITISRSGLASGDSFSFSPVVSIKLNGDSPISIDDILN